MKHAYLILAHNKLDVLKRLLLAIDDLRNDIYIHIDKKASFSIDDLYVCKSKLYIIPDRLDVRWGDFSLVLAELNLMNEAVNNGSYSYMHILSGVDFPIKSQDYIHQFCDTHQGTEFIGFSKNVTEKELLWRSQHYFLFSKDFQSRNLYKRCIRALFIKIQDFCCFYRNNIEIKKGPQWCSFTSDFCRYILSQKEYIYKIFSHTYCPDELFIQTLCWNSEFRNKIYSYDNEFIGCMRYIPWYNGELRSFSENDFFNMKESQCWFARKFTSKDIDFWESL